MEELKATDVFPLLMNVNRFPLAQLHKGISYPSIEGFAPGRDSLEAAKRASMFLTVLDRIFTKMKFDNHYQTHAVYYQRLGRDQERVAAARRDLYDGKVLREAFYGICTHAQPDSAFGNGVWPPR